MKVGVTLSSSIYPSECLHAAIAAYQEFCSVKVVSETPTGYSIEINQLVTTTDEKYLADEFLNYLLDLSLEKHLTGFQKNYGTDRISAP